MQRQNIGTPFLERILRTGKKRNALLNTPVSGGVNLPSPTGLGSGQQPPPRRTPAADVSQQLGGSVAAPPLAAAAPAPAAPPIMPQQPPSSGGAPADLLPPLDQELPVEPGSVAGPMTLAERFYRQRGRLPVEEESYLLHLRSRFEGQLGRPPTKAEIAIAMRRAYEVREDEVSF